MYTECSLCKRKYIYSRGKGHTTKNCNSCIANKRKYIIKDMCLEYKGKQCIICGYNKTTKALVFHHTNPKEKDFTISGSHGRSWDSIKKELDKCVLLCANCHAEEHERLSLTGPD